MHPVLKHVLVVDIETVSSAPDLHGLDTNMQLHWQHKAQFLRKEEDQSPDQLYQDRAAIYAEFGQVVTIGFGAFFQENDKLRFKVKSFAGRDESVLLQRFIDLVNQFDQDQLRLCGHNGKEFDFPYLCRRMVVHGLPIPWAMDLSGKKPWEVQHIDTLELWKFGDRKNFTSLKLLTDLLGIPSSKEDIDGSKVHSIYYQDKDGLEKIARYCEGDVVATAQLYLRLNQLPLLSDEDIIRSQ
jgi:hypothetical protein